MSDDPSPLPPEPAAPVATPVEPRTGGVTLALTRDDRVAVVGLARPEVLNAQTPATWAALATVRDTLPASVRVVVVRGAGRAFSAGLDRRLERRVRCDPLDGQYRDECRRCLEYLASRGGRIDLRDPGLNPRFPRPPGA